MHASRRRLALALLSTLLSLAVAAPIVRSRITSSGDGGTVQVVDTTAELEATLNSAGAGGGGDPGDDLGFVLRPLDEEVAAHFFPSIRGKSDSYDPDCYLVRGAGLKFNRRWPEHPDGKVRIETNSEGLRGPREVRADKPAFRVVVTGDSHIAGVVNHDELITHHLETELQSSRNEGEVEVINAAVGGYTLYNYLGTLERLRRLDPDVFVVIVYGGNDFYDAAKLQRYMEERGSFKRTSPLKGRRRAAWDATGPVRSQELMQVRYFLANPGDEREVARAVKGVLRHMDERCEELSIELVVAYLPPPLAVQSSFFEDVLENALSAIGAGMESLEVSDRIADEMLSFLQEEGIEHRDLRPRFRSSDELLYWRSDFHINTLGHRVAAEEILALVEAHAR
ncbi:MAG: SGNH/GDSL hydrolase family protein [Planctomycetota bacterium]